MEDIDVRLFSKCVNLYFSPIAERNNLTLCQISEDLYEIKSREFVMRIHFEVGHRKSVLATLSKNGKQGDGQNRKIGVAVIAGYNGAEMRTMPAATIEEFIKLAELTAKNADRFCVPYLLGLKDDFPKIIAYIDDLIDKSGIREKKYRFSEKVREEWKVKPQSE